MVFVAGIAAAWQSIEWAKRKTFVRMASFVAVVVEIFAVSFREEHSVSHRINHFDSHFVSPIFNAAPTISCAFCPVLSLQIIYQ